MPFDTFPLNERNVWIVELFYWKYFNMKSEMDESFYEGRGQLGQSTSKSFCDIAPKQKVIILLDRRPHWTADISRRFLVLTKTKILTPSLISSQTKNGTKIRGEGFWNRLFHNFYSNNTQFFFFLVPFSGWELRICLEGRIYS